MSEAGGVSHSLSGAAKRFLLRADPALAGAMILLAAIKLPFLDFIPIWDGRNYWDECLAPAILAPFNPIKFNCFGHPSMAYMVLATAGQEWFFGSAKLLNLANLVLGFVSIAAFYSIQTLVLPSTRRSLEGFLITALFAIHPTVVSASFNLNPDYGVVVFLLPFLAALLRKRTILAALFGCLLVFSKEPGLLLYPLAVGVFLFVFVWPFAAGISQKVARTLMHFGLLVPGAAFGIYALGKRLTGESVLWAHSGGGDSLVRTFLRFDLTDPVLFSYMTGVFVVSFGWLLTLPIVIDWATSAIHWFRTRQRYDDPESEPSQRRFLLLYFLAALFLLTRFRTFSNLRYFLPLFPILALSAAVALHRLVRNRSARLSYLALSFVLIGLSNFRTFDPVSRSIYGTFRFGEHDMLKMTSITGECCGYGRDQLLYNLEALQFHYAQNSAYAAIHPRNREVILANPRANWFLEGPLNPVSFERTLDKRDAIMPLGIHRQVLMEYGILPNEAWYFEFPNFDNSEDLAWVDRYYERSHAIELAVVATPSRSIGSPASRWRKSHPSRGRNKNL